MEPVEDVIISARVGGEVVRRAPAFVPGGFVKKGEVLLQIDPADYRNNLELRQSELLQAQTELDVEMGRQEVAQQDLELVGDQSLTPGKIPGVAATSAQRGKGQNKSCTGSCRSGATESGSQHD